MAYSDAAQDYIRAMRGLFAPGIRSAERGGGVAPAEELAARAEAALPASQALTQAAAAKLQDRDLQVRDEAAAQLLAKALTDLEAGAYLYGQTEEGEPAKAERGTGWFGLDAERERLLLGEGRVLRGERGGVPPADIPSARVALLTAIEDTLALIKKRSRETSQKALNGIVGLGLSEIASAAGLLLQGAANAVGWGEGLSRVWAAIQGFVRQAWEALLSLIGPELGKLINEQIKEWLEKFKSDGPEKMFEWLYQTGATLVELKPRVEQSPAGLEKYQLALQKVDALPDQHWQQMDLLEKILKVASFISRIPLTTLPWAKLLLVALYTGLGGYAIVVGGDYVDAKRLQRLGRVAGVREVVEAQLA